MIESMGGHRRLRLEVTPFIPDGEGNRRLRFIRGIHLSKLPDDRVHMRSYEVEVKINTYYS